MFDLQTLQAYWWLLIAVLGAFLVFLLFVQGGQSMLLCLKPDARRLAVNAIGRKWEFTYTTLVVFGGAFFASFPLYYSTSFGGAYWLWMLILISFVLQAVSYEFRRKRGNLYGTLTYDIFLTFNGFVGCVLLGCAVGMMFFGGEFTITKANLLDSQAPVISQWSSAHGFDVICDWRCILLGVTVFFLARTQAALYFINNIRATPEFDASMRRKVLINGAIFAVLFVGFTLVLLLSPGRQVQADGSIAEVPYLYWNNLISMWWAAVMFAAGVVMVLYAIIVTALTRTWSRGIWWSGIGTILVVLVLFFLAGYNGTAYLPSTIDPQSSLTLANSSSSLFTLRVMSVVSLIIPFVLAYIIYVWHKMNAVPLTSKELDKESHVY